MLETMRNKDHRGRFVPFTVRVLTVDRTKKTGGDWLELVDVTLPQKEASKLSSFSTKKSEPTTRKDPKHLQNGTINLKLPNTELRKAHLRLIRKFNGMTVI
jgi:hypothetical protein